jgi:hypothetical protein
MSAEGPKAYPVVYDADLGLQYSYQSGYIVIPEASANSITALTGDITAAGPGSVPATLATVNSNVGSFTNASITVNAKGLITAASSGTAPVLYTAGAGLTLTGSVFSATPSVVDSTPTVGGAAAESVAVAGLHTTSTIWAVTQRTMGGAALPLEGWTNTLDGHLTVIYSADMGVGAIVRVLFIP